MVWESEILLENELSSDPFEEFSIWYSKAQEIEKPEPTAFYLATATKLGIPSVRTVLLKGFDKNGFIFFTNYESQKSLDLLENPTVQMLFHWAAPRRQIRISGDVEKISEADSNDYFKSRPYGSQISAWVSKQSQKVKNRENLIASCEKYKTQYPKNVPKPPNWGGFLIRPNYFEFWKCQENRLHDRIIYEREGKAWVKGRLSP